jgi:hypothetical protein
MATADLRAVDSDEDTVWPDGVLRPRATDPVRMSIWRRQEV